MARGDAETIVETAYAASGAHEIDPSKRYVVVTPSNGKEVIEPVKDSELLAPRRRRGLATVYDTDALKYLWDKAASEQSELYGDPINYVLTAVLNADKAATDGTAGHGDHRIQLVCKRTAAWDAWLAKDGDWLNQIQFSEFLEDRIVDMHDPSGSEMLDIATTFQAKSKVEFKSVAVLQSGQRGLQYEETTQASAGKGSVEVPATFVIALQPFEGSLAYKITARLRFRINSGNLMLAFKLERPEDVLREAFNDVRTAAEQACDRPALLGSPAPARA